MKVALLFVDFLSPPNAFTKKNIKARNTLFPKKDVEFLEFLNFIRRLLLCIVE